MGSLLKTLLSGVYVKLRGRSVVSTTQTQLTLQHLHRMSDSDNASFYDRYVTLLCVQFRHDVTYERWYMPASTHYTYKVSMVHHVGVDDKHHLPDMIYPHVCAMWLANTTYPHHCAINAYIDALLEPKRRRSKLVPF